MEMLELAAELKWCRERIAAYEVEREQMQQYYRHAVADRDNVKATLEAERDRLRVLVERFVNRQDRVWKSYPLKHSDPLYTDCLAALKENSGGPA